MNELIATSSALFESTVGFSWTEVVTFVVDIGKILLGGGFGVLQATIGWIVTILVIGFIVKKAWAGLVSFFH